MLTYDADQNTVVAASSKTFAWLVTVITTAPDTYYWSLVTKTYGGHPYTASIIAGTFSGPKLLASGSEYGIQAPNTLTFQLTNTETTLTASAFLDAAVTVVLVCNDEVPTGDQVMGTWKFNVKRCDPEAQKLKFECEDILQKYIKGDWPNTTLVKDAFLSNDSVDQSRCIPVPIGNPFVPLDSILSGGNRYYLLGPASKTYTISKVRSPRGMGYKHDHSSPAFTFTQSGDKKGLDDILYKVFTALIAENATHGLFQNGDSFYPLPTKFTRTDTAQINGSETGTNTEAVESATVLTDAAATFAVDQLIGVYVVNNTDGSYAKITDNAVTTVTVAALAGGVDNKFQLNDTYTIGGPASVISWILRDFGVLAADIDDTTFGIAEKAFAGFTIVWNYAWTTKQSRKTILSSLLSQCNAHFVIRDKICLIPNSKTSQKTLTTADITKPQEIGSDSFRTTRLERVDNDSGFIEWQPADEIQDEWQKVRVSAKYSSGVHDGGDAEAVLADSTQNWPTDSLIGGTVKNTTQDESATITANTDTTVTGALSGAATWDDDDVYEIDVSNNISDESLPVYMIQDSQDAQRAGICHFQKKFLAKSQITYNSKATCLMLEPGDVATINNADYGGEYDFLITSINIKEGISMSHVGKTYDI